MSMTVLSRGRVNGAGDSTETLLRAFSPDEFQEWPSWRRLQRFLRSNGGSYGLSGPRGAGKTWHMRRAVRLAQDHRGIGLWYPSPSEYESSAFLLSLTETFADAIEAHWRDENPGRVLPTERSNRPALMAGLLVGGAAFAVVSLIATSLNGFMAAIGAGLIAGGFLPVMMDATFGSRVRRDPRLRLLVEAKRLKQAVRFSLRRRESLELAAQGNTGVVAKLNKRHEDEFTERPLTLSTLIYGFRRLAEQVADVVKGPVVIAIDELDKIADEESVRALLRDIKGIFDVPGVYFLVSVSHEAARSLRLGGLSERNEFSSSFETVLELPPLDVNYSQRLLEKRSGAECAELWCALSVMAGGVPREVIRLGEHVWHDATNAVPSRPQAVRMLAELEALEFRRQVVTATASGPNGISPEARIGVFEALSRSAFQEERFSSFAADISERWHPPWASPAWEESFGEGWRRLVLRLYVAGLLATHDAETLFRDAQRLQDVGVISSQSAAVAALFMIDEGLAPPSITRASLIKTVNARDGWNNEQ